MKRLFVISTAALLLVAIQIPGFAHHSVSAQFDSSKATTITGMITKVDWANPHAWLYMTVRNGNQSVTWHIQISAPGALKQVGIEKGMIDLTSLPSLSRSGRRSPMKLGLKPETGDC